MGYKSTMELISTAKAAEVLGVSERRVRVLITEGRLPAQKVGRDYVVNADDLALVAKRPTGRPKAKDANGSKPARKRAAKS
jgi:excisionase family DNA binding protein